MKRRDLLNIAKQIKLLKDVKNTQLAYNLLQNLNKIDKMVQPINIVQAKIDKLATTKLQEYQTKRIDLCHDHAKLDEDGRPIIIKVNDVEQYDIKDKEVFDKDLQVLIEEYKDVFNDQKELQGQIAELLNEEVEIDIIKVDTKFLPKDLSLLDLEKIKDIIKI